MFLLKAKDALDQGLGGSDKLIILGLKCKLSNNCIGCFCLFKPMYASGGLKTHITLKFTVIARDLGRNSHGIPEQAMSVSKFNLHSC